MSSFFQVDCHCLKAMLQQEYCRHAAYGEHVSSVSFQDINTDVSLQKKAGTSTSSSPQEGDKDGHAKQQLRYNSSHSQVDYVSARHDVNFACLNGRKSYCAYCGMFNHDVSR